MSISILPACQSIRTLANHKHCSIGRTGKQQILYQFPVSIKSSLFSFFFDNFRQYMGMSPAQYVLSLRMVNAQSLLEHTNYNVKEISEIVGYDNPLYFSRVFKKEIGQSPAQYRKLRGEPAEE